MSLRYKNRAIINQRGGSIDFNNSTDIEKVQLSHRSGSNINLTNVVTSELASNNKQTLVINDSFETVGHNSSKFVVKNKTERVGETSFTLKGFIDESELDAYKEWKDTYKPIALINSQFKINRGGKGYPDGQSAALEGKRAVNPVLSCKVTTVENKFSGYNSTPIRQYSVDEVASYSPVAIRTGAPAKSKTINTTDITTAAGSAGSKAPGVLEFGPIASAATENGQWTINKTVDDLPKTILEYQEKLFPIEQKMGNGGDDISFVKKNKVSTVGAAFNDYPSIRVDEKGRSHPFEVIVGRQGAFKNHDYFPVVEDVDNTSSFPGGDSTEVIGNKYNVTIGSGGLNLKTTGGVEIGGTNFKGGFKKFNVSSTYGVHLLSENIIELSSLKSITLRTNRQVFVESSLGVKNNVIVGGGAYIEGETYLQHITAPIEVQQTEDTILLGKFNTTSDRTMPIGEVNIPDAKGNDHWYVVYAYAADNLTINYPHSHHFKNLPLRLLQSNADVRRTAQGENINSHGAVSPSLAQRHERK